MLGQADGGWEFSSKKASTRLGSDQAGYPLILPCVPAHKETSLSRTKTHFKVVWIYRLTKTFKAESVDFFFLMLQRETIQAASEFAARN